MALLRVPFGSTLLIGLALGALCLSGQSTSSPAARAGNAGAAAASAPITGDEFSAAIRASDLRKIRLALNNGASANARTGQGETALMLAAVYADADCLRLLLDRGADVNATNPAGATALIRAAGAGDVAKLRLLLERGAKVNARSAMGNSALMLAARPARAHRAVELLLARGADAKVTNAFGGSALMAAAAGGDAKSVKLLLAHGADATAQTAPSEPGFLFGGGRSALMWAAFRGDVEIIELLLNAGADVNEVGMFGTPLAQAAWGNRTEAAQLLLARGARPELTGMADGFAPLHWAASSEDRDTTFAKLLLAHGANPNQGGGEPVDAFLGTPQTPMMLARRRGNAGLLSMLATAGATNPAPERTTTKRSPPRELPPRLNDETVREAIAQAVPPLQKTSLFSKHSFLSHASRQDCVSCHSQHLPMAAFATARKQPVPLDRAAEQELIRLVRAGEFGDIEPDLQPLFHPDAAHTKGYAFLAFAAQELPADSTTDAWVHHLANIQGPDGNWFNNLPRPPMQTDDIGATALAIHALQTYPLPGRREALAKQVEHARRWLWKARPENNEGRAYQLLGLAWAGESPRKLQSLARALAAQQRSDGGWAQLPGLDTDAYATGQSVYALRVAAGWERAHPSVERGLCYLVGTQLEDGTWHVRRRAFPFQPTMNSGFPHGRDSWISTAGTSWAVLALGLPEQRATVAAGK